MLHRVFDVIVVYGCIQTFITFLLSVGKVIMTTQTQIIFQVLRFLLLFDSLMCDPTFDQSCVKFGVIPSPPPFVPLSLLPNSACTSPWCDSSPPSFVSPSLLPHSSSTSPWCDDSPPLPCSSPLTHSSRFECETSLETGNQETCNFCHHHLSYQKHWKIKNLAHNSGLTNLFAQSFQCKKFIDRSQFFLSTKYIIHGLDRVTSMVGCEKFELETDTVK